MNGWQKLKNIFNKDKKICRSALFHLIDIPGATLDIYLHHLSAAGFIKKLYEKELNPIPYYKLILEIPKKITFHEVIEMSHNPWMTWFKYPELIERK